MNTYMYICATIKKTNNTKREVVMKVIFFSKKIFAAVMSMFFALTFCSIPAFATDSVINENSTDYIDFTKSDERMSANGNFTFQFKREITSDRFVARGSYISVNTSACLMRSETGMTFTDNSEEFEVTLYRDGVVDTVVGRYIGCANNVYGGVTFSGIKKGDRYYFKMRPVAGNFTVGNYEFLGHGNVSPVDVLQS